MYFHYFLSSKLIILFSIKIVHFLSKIIKKFVHQFTLFNLKKNFIHSPKYFFQKKKITSLLPFSTFEHNCVNKLMCMQLFAMYLYTDTCMYVCL